jgi:hypothetical protein
MNTEPHPVCGIPFALEIIAPAVNWHYPQDSHCGDKKHDGENRLERFHPSSYVAEWHRFLKLTSKALTPASN